MSLRVAVQMDPMENIKIGRDSTFAIMLEAQKRGHRLYHYLAPHLSYVDGQVRALEAAEASSQSALDANRLGYQVGVRINIDVLNAQSQLFQTKRDLAQARYNVLLGHLRLRGLCDDGRGSLARRLHCDGRGADGDVGHAAGAPPFAFRSGNGMNRHLPNLRRGGLPEVKRHRSGFPM